MVPSQTTTTATVNSRSQAQPRQQPRSQVELRFVANLVNDSYHYYHSFVSWARRFLIILYFWYSPSTGAMSSGQLTCTRMRKGRA